MGHFQQHLPVQHLGVGEYIGQIVDGAGRHIHRLQIGDPGIGRAGQKMLLQQRNQHRPVFHPHAVGRKLRTVFQVHPTDALAEPRPQPFRPDRYIQVLAILPHKGLVRHQGGMGRAQPLRRAAVGKVVAGLVSEPSHLRVQH